MLRLTNNVTIAAGEIKEVSVYFDDHTDSLGILETADNMKTNNIIFLHTWFNNTPKIFIHKLIKSIPVNNYPRAATRIVLEEEYTEIEAGMGIGYIIKI